MNKKNIALLIFIFLFSSCTIGNYEFKKIEEKKEVEKISNKKILEEMKDLKDEMAEIRKIKEKELKIKEKEDNKKNKKLTKEELELKLLEVENKKLEVENKKIDIDTENKKEVNFLKKGEFCLLDNCLYKKGIEIKGIGKINDIFVGKDFYFSFIGDNSCKENDILKDEKKCRFASKMGKNKLFLEKIINLGEKTEKVFINKFLNFYIKTLVTKDKNEFSIISEFFDKNGKQLKNSESKKLFLKEYKLLSEKIKIGNIDYELKNNFEKINPVFNDKNTLLLNDMNYINSKIISLKIENLALNEKYLYKNYIFLVDKEKQIYILYSSNDKQSERILNLGVDQKWLKENISESGDFLNRELSEKIIGYYGLKTKKALYNGKDKRIFSSSGEDFPIFKVKKFNNKGNYLLILKQGFYTK